MISVADKMKQQLRIQLQKLQENMPETEKKLAELAKAGKITPESAEKLKRLLQQFQAKQ